MSSQLGRWHAELFESISLEFYGFSLERITEFLATSYPPYILSFYQLFPNYLCKSFYFSISFLFALFTPMSRDFPGGSDGKASAYNVGDWGSIPGFNPWVGKISWRRQWHPTPVFLPGKSHGQRSLVEYNPWGRKESDRTERLHFHFSLSCIREGNSHPLQCSCLENPRARGAWWAAVYGVTQSQTRLKQLSSSSSHFIL